jgi:hypothetical protein
LSALLATRTVVTPQAWSPTMSTHSTGTAITDLPIWCKGCKSIQPFSSFLYKLDPECYRLHLQCVRCLHKSSENYRKHREDIKAARLAREQEHERVACVCGVTINVRHRDKHCRSKRHQSVVALLRNASVSPPAAAGALVVSDEAQQQALLELPRNVRSRYRPSLPRLDETSTAFAAVPLYALDMAGSTSV